MTTTGISFSGKTVIITGSSSGIGAETALLFAKLGANLVLTGRNVAQLDEVKDKCIKNGLKADQVVAVIGEITEDNVRHAIIDAAINNFKRIDVLVNNAGLLILTPLSDFNVENHDKMQDVNVRSVILLSILALPHLKATKGSIVNVSSAASSRPAINSFSYCISKAALDMVTRAMAFEVASDGVRINSVNPGGVPTNIFRNVQVNNKEADNELAKSMISYHPLGRWGKGSEIAEAIVFLASENAAFTTGAIFAIDGGATIYGVK